MFIGIFLALLATIAHSGSYIFRKRGLEEIDYKVFIILRIQVGFILSCLLLWTLGPGLAGLTFPKMLPFIVSGIIVTIFSVISTTLAIHEIGASRTHALTSASPLITALLGTVFLGERLTSYLFFGLILIVLGGSILSYKIHGDRSSGKIDRPLFGFGLATYTTVAIGANTVLQKYGLGQGVTPIQGLFIRLSTALIFYGGYLLVTRAKLNLKTNYRSPDFLWASILLTGVTLLTLLALDRLPATLVAGLMRTAPLFTVTLSAFLLKGIEKVDWQTFAIATTIVAGAILAIVG